MLELQELKHRFRRLKRCFFLSTKIKLSAHLKIFHPFQNILPLVQDKEVKGSPKVKLTNGVCDWLYTKCFVQPGYIPSSAWQAQKQTLFYVNPYFILSLKSKQLFSNFGRESMFHTATTKKRVSTALATHLLLKKLSNLSSVHKLRQMTRQAFINLHWPEARGRLHLLAPSGALVVIKV